MNEDNGMKIGVESQKMPQAAFVAKKFDERFNPKSIVHPSQFSSNTKGGGQPSDHDHRDEMFCNYFKKKRHTKDMLEASLQESKATTKFTTNPRKVYVAKTIEKEDQNTIESTYGS